MKQVVQSFRNGELKVVEVPISAPAANQILVRTTASVLSAGTERVTAEFSEKTLLGKAISRPDLVKQVMQKLKNDGPVNTLKASFAKLDVPLALGYSSAGVVIEVGRNVSSVVVGDRVACAGMGYASHAEAVVVPQNLFIKIPEGVTDEEAAFSTIGAIALQGLRVADLRLGEKVVVIGLGLIGLITIQLLKASGCKVFAVDIDPAKVDFALNFGADEGTTTDDGIIKAVEGFTDGRGADAVLITAATSSNTPTEQAGDIARHKARIVFVGDVKMDIPRRTYYKKELEVRLSMSYGPGRYDPQYEEKGIDYPYAYVPFTEQRNMETFLHLVKEKQVEPAKLITHHFGIEDAHSAYRLIKGETKENFVGVVFNYPQDFIPTCKVKLTQMPTLQQRNLNVGVIGAGNYAKQMLLPNLKKLDKTKLVGIATSTGISGQHTGEKYGFLYCTTDCTEIILDDKVNTVVIATRHNTHASITIKALQMGKHVFVEKPLALTRTELDEVLSVALKSQNHLMVGFNRRFAPLAQQAKSFFAARSQPLCMIYRVNAGFIPQEHWSQEKSEGGRIVGEVCHFIDFMQFLCGSLPESVFAVGAGSLSPEENISINIRFADGSIGSIHYFANGDKRVPKEYIEIFGEGKVVQIKDFRKGYFTSQGNTKKIGGWNQDKGQKQMLQAFQQAILSGGLTPISLEEIAFTTRTTFSIMESLRQGGKTVFIENNR